EKGLDVLGVDVGLGRGEEERAHPHAIGARRQRCRHGTRGADATGGYDGHVDGLEHGVEQREQGDRPPHVAACLHALGHDAISAGTIGTPSMPSPPALETAAASSGVVTPPMPACCSGTVHPTSSVNFVVSMAPS